MLPENTGPPCNYKIIGGGLELPQSPSGDAPAHYEVLAKILNQ